MVVGGGGLVGGSGGVGGRGGRGGRSDGGGGMGGCSGVRGRGGHGGGSGRLGVRVGGLKRMNAINPTVVHQSYERRWGLLEQSSQNHLLVSNSCPWWSCDPSPPPQG